MEADQEVIFTYDVLFQVHIHTSRLSAPMRQAVYGRYCGVASALIKVREDALTHGPIPLAQPSDVRWASRWDTYLLMMDDQIHWFSIINSLMIVLFLSGMVAMIMMRTLHRDISNYNQLETAEEVQDETGWKLVRPLACRTALLPRHPCSAGPTRCSV